MRPAYDPDKEELFHVWGDQDTGISTEADMTHGSTKIQLRYDGKWGNYVCTVDFYSAGGECSIVMICPRCHHSIKVDSSRKQIEFDPEKGLFVSRSECPWEMNERDGERMEFGLNLCRFGFEVEGTRIRDA